MREERGGGGGGRDKRQEGRKGGADAPRRGFFRRRRVCKFCAEKIDYINYKDVPSAGAVPARSAARFSRGGFRARARCTSASCRSRSSARVSSR